MGFCDESEYQEFLHSCPEFERMLVRSGIILIKYWFSVSDEEQERRFQDRIHDVTKQLEVEFNGSAVTGALGRVFSGQGRDVCAHGYQTGVLVCRQRRQEKMCAAECDLTLALADPV